MSHCAGTPLQSTFSGGSPERWTVSCCGVCPAWIPTGLALAVIEEVRFAADSPLEGADCPLEEGIRTLSLCPEL